MALRLSDHDADSARALVDDLSIGGGEPTSAELHEEYAAAFAKVLDVENPIVTATLVNILNEDDACALFISYITRPSDGADDDDADSSAEREREGEGASNELRRSFRATMLLTSDDTSDALITFLPRKSALLTRSIFAVFDRRARGNLRHACRVLDYLLRMYLDDVYDVVGRSAASVQQYVAPMLAYLDHAYVAEAFLTMVCKPHSAALMRFYASAPQKKWAFFRALSDWKLLLVLAEHVHNATYGEAHNVGAADVFVELLERLAADDNGELLLQPAAYCPELLEGLVRAAVDTSAARSIGQRTGAIKCVLRLLQKSTSEKVAGPPTSPYQSFGGTVVNLVPNQLAPLRARIFALAEQHVSALLQYVVEQYEEQQNIEMDLASGKPLPAGAVRHTGYVVKVPFTEFRLTLVEVLVEIVAQNPRQLGAHFDARVWRVLVTWFFEYSHTNLYHAAFYQLLFLALRSDNPAALEALVKKQKLVTALVEHFRHGGTGASNRGYILQCCNAIRLQAAAQAPDAFLRNFLQSHTTWRHFEPELRALTAEACVAGLGFAVPQVSRPGMFQRDSWQLLASRDDDVAGIDHGSEFARSLGFIDDVAWPEDDCDGSGDGSGKKKKKKKRGGKAKKENGGGAASDSGSAAAATDDESADDDDNNSSSNDTAAGRVATNGSIDDDGDDDKDKDNGDATLTTAPAASPSASPKKPKSKKKKHKKK